MPNDTTPAPIGADALREALWICVEHNALHFGETHNTVVQGRAALQSQPQEKIAYVTRNEEDGPAMLFFDLKEARLYCNPDEEPEALVLAVSALQSQDREDAERYRWLRQQRTISAHACVTWNIGHDWVQMDGAELDAAIDHARRIEGDGE